MHGLYAIGQPNSEPMMDPTTLAPYGYDERVPAKIYTINSTDVTGTALNWKMEAELRYVAETYPSGSLRSPFGRRSVPIHLGSTILYETEVVIDYRRDKDT